MQVFVDTNVLVYVRDRSDEAKQRRAAEWIGALWESGRGRLSHQVLAEYYVTLTTKLDPPRSTEDVRDDLMALSAWRPVPTDLELFRRAWTVQDRFGFSWWDALIVAGALRSGARYLLTEDLRSGQEIESLTVIDPFEHRPEEILG